MRSGGQRDEPRGIAKRGILESHNQRRRTGVDRLEHHYCTYDRLIGQREERRGGRPYFTEFVACAQRITDSHVFVVEWDTYIQVRRGMQNRQ